MSETSQTVTDPQQADTSTAVADASQTQQEPVNPAASKPMFQSSESDDSVLDRLMSSGEQQQETDETQGQDGEPGKQQPGEPDETADQTDETAQAQDDQQKPVEPDGYREAVNALRRVKVPLKQLEAMDPADVVAWHKELQPVLAAQDSLNNQRLAAERERDELRQRLEQNQQQPAPTDAGGTDAAGQQQSQQNQSQQQQVATPADDQIATLIGTVRENYGDELAEPMQQIVNHYQGTIQRLEQSHEQQSQALRADLTFYANELEGLIVDQVRSGLAETYPGIADDEKFASVRDHATKLLQSGTATTIKDALRQGAILEFADQKLSDFQKQQLARVREKNQGQPRVPNRTSRAPAQAKTLAEREDAALDALLEGRGIDEARREYETARGA